MALSVLDIFKIGIGPSSSHTVGPMRAAARFARWLEERGLLEATASVHVGLYGSLGATGKGHGSGDAVLLGLQGEQPENVDTESAPRRLAAMRAARELHLLGRRAIRFVEPEHLLYFRKALPFHPNGMRFQARAGDGTVLAEREYYSVGGGFVVEDGSVAAGTAPAALPYPYASGDDLLALCQRHGMSISALMQANEAAWRPAAETSAALARLWQVMQECVEAGCAHEGVLPGPLAVRRRAPALGRQLRGNPQAAALDPLVVLDWVCLYALAVNEENAAGGRVVTAPTNGAAGIVPAVLHYYTRFIHGADAAGVERFLLTAAAIAILYKENASISGAEVGCQGEVGVACSMAAGALAEVLGGTPAQVENAAEIGMEHNLGLTCDPVGGRVQVPCIERNAMGAVKAIQAARMALLGDGHHYVSLDQVIKTMRDTGADMKTQYKETSRGGLAVNVIEC
ncbi:L-serine ammonia-lyase [Ramlibacter sp.]|jgi:L-serine dehydratase|uniref:L-serine ammonia-lyase n=1 Tax=Ramlibacter sp. TaxID=1917967 RepID=UPI0026367476|nr:L-serine ammonia-lyase [Ramlibacter sp.]MDB5953437.1 L-serine ammonia-lyase [Ramlibacter sp.]